MILRIWAINKWCTRPVLLNATDDHGFVIIGWTNEGAKLHHVKLPLDKLKAFYSPPDSTIIYKTDVLGVTRSGNIEALQHWVGPHPEGWDLRRFGHNQYIGRKYEALWAFKQVTTGWKKGASINDHGGLPVKFSRLKKAPTEGWYMINSDYYPTTLKRLVDVVTDICKSMGTTLELEV